MDKKTDTWKRITEVAQSHGLSYWAIRKWVKRGVPTKWQIVIVEETGGSVSFDDFKKLKRGEPA